LSNGAVASYTDERRKIQVPKKLLKRKSVERKFGCPTENLIKDT
jgi:hypothetical protein